MRAYRVLEESRAREIASSVRDLDWGPGKATSQRRTTKNNLELLEAPELDEIKQALRSHDLFTQNFISEISPPKFNWYRDSGEYRIHSDAALMHGVRTDLACTLFLSDDYDGGELNIDGKSIKAKPGIAVVYECWKPHWVNPVTRGDRISAICWMRSFISEAWKRDLLNTLHETAMKAGNQEQFAKIGAVHEKLFKHWMR